jgi:TolA-binding protein
LVLSLVAPGSAHADVPGIAVVLSAQAEALREPLLLALRLEFPDKTVEVVDAMAARVEPRTDAPSRAHEIVAQARRRASPRLWRLAPVALLAAAAIAAALALRPGALAPPVRRAQRPARVERPAPPATSPAPALAGLEVVLASGMRRPEVAAEVPFDVPEGARLGLRLGDGTALAFGGGSRATLRREGDGVAIDLTAGEVECLVAKQGQRHPAGDARVFSVRAPGVEARVHGTRFVVRAATSDVFVLEGRVEIRRKGAPAALVDGAPAPTGVEPAAWLDGDAPCGARSPEGTGEIAITGAGELRVDGMPVGAAPAVLRCTAGPHRIERLVGQRTEETTVVVEAGAIASLRSGAEAEPEAETETETEAETEPEAEPETEAEPEAEAEPDTAVAEARRLLAARRYSAARGALEAWLSAHPGDLRAMFLLGEAQRLGGDAGAAERTYERIVQGGAGLPVANALTSLALLAERRGPAAALAAWDRYLAAQPRGNVAAEATLRRANALVGLGRRAEARAALERFLREYPGHPRREEVRRRLQARED